MDEQIGGNSRIRVGDGADRAHGRSPGVCQVSIAPSGGSTAQHASGVDLPTAGSLSPREDEPGHRTDDVALGRQRTLIVQGSPNLTFVGSEQIRSFWETSGSFTHRRFSVVPSFKTQIDVHGDEAWLYFECHDIGDYDLPDRSIASDTFLAGTVRNVGGKWVFSNMTAGKAFPLSVNHFYFP